MQEDFIKTELAKYNVSDAKIATLKQEYLPLRVKDVEDIENYMLCKEAHQTVKKIRIAIEAKRKELKASSLEFGKAVDGEARRITTSISYIEGHLMEQREVVESEKKRIQEEVERKEREEQERVHREEEERLEAQRREQEEKEIKLQEEREKIEADKRAIEEEKQRIADEKVAEEAKLKEAAEYKKRAEQAEKDHIEREKRHAEEVENAKKDAAEKAKREEKERIGREAREQEERAEAERVKADKAKLIAPDKEKILTYGAELEDVVVPQLKTSEATVVLDGVVKTLSRSLARMKEEANKL